MNAPLHPDRWPSSTPANDDAVDDVPDELRPFVDAMVALCLERLSRGDVPSLTENDDR